MIGRHRTKLCKLFFFSKTLVVKENKMEEDYSPDNSIQFDFSGGRNCRAY